MIFAANVDGTTGLPGLGGFLRARRQQIVALWLEGMRSLPAARDLPVDELINHLPALLSHLVATLELAEPQQSAEAARAPADHAIRRLSLGFGLGDVVQEYALLRRCVLD